ncbi:MAG: hypothetical protein RL115_852 [Bacteroidota bacterium]|jgi:hypothetical protein
MRKIIVLALALSLLTITNAQTDKEVKSSTHTTFYAELGGPGILFSANIDKRFKQSNLGWGGRIGLGFVSGYVLPDTSSMYYSNNLGSVVTIPVQVNHIFGKPNSPHTFEVGAGITITGKKIEVFDFYEEKRSAIFGTASFMYRRQPIDGGFMWRIGFTPIIAKGYIQAFGGVGVGYSF